MEIIYYILAWVIVIPIAKFVSNRRKAKQDAENAEMGDFYGLDDDRVIQIVKGAYLDLKRQRADARSPWLESLLEGPLYILYDDRGRTQVKVLNKPIAPGVALSAIVMTIRDILSAPISYDKDGREMPRRVFNLDALNKAKAELMEMMGEGE